MTVVVILEGSVTVVTGTTGGQESRVVTWVGVTEVPLESVVVTVAVDTHPVTEGAGEDSQWSLVTVVVTVSGSPAGLVVVRVTVSTQSATGTDEEEELWGLQSGAVTVVTVVSESPPGFVVVRVTVDTQGSVAGAGVSEAGSVEGTEDLETPGSVELKPGVLDATEVEGSGVG